VAEGVHANKARIEESRPVQGQQFRLGAATSSGLRRHGDDYWMSTFVNAKRQSFVLIKEGLKVKEVPQATIVLQL
jgi:hypothetical protein